jgi:hypothetical protein
MADSETTRAEQPGGITAGVHLNETMLRSEVAFWQEMIGCRSDAMPADAVERMHQALALAESRLIRLYQDFSDSSSPKVLQLDQARRKRNEQGTRFTRDDRKPARAGNMARVAGHDSHGN